MPTCESCGKQIKEGDWSCGFCGAPVSKVSAGASGAASELHTGAFSPGTSAPTSAYQLASGAGVATSRRGVSRGLLIGIAVAAMAVVAILLVWLFVVRGGGSPFDGTWNFGTTAGVAHIVISGSEDETKIEFTGKDSSGQTRSSTVPAHMDGPDLVVTVDDFVKATGSEEQATQVKAAFEALIKDFRLVFSLQDSSHLKMTVEGTLASGVQSSAGQRSVVLTRVE